MVTNRVLESVNEVWFVTTTLLFVTNHSISAATASCFVVTKSRAVTNAIRFAMNTSLFSIIPAWFKGNADWDGAIPVWDTTKQDCFATKQS